jgi:hypothetical protein
VKSADIARLRSKVMRTVREADMREAGMRKLIVALEREAVYFIEAVLTPKDLEKAAGLKGEKLIAFIDRHAANRNWSVPTNRVNEEPMWDTAEAVANEPI